MHSVILAGGSGTRFWPHSRRKHPKQLLALTNSQSLIAQTIQRLTAYKKNEGVYVIASGELSKLIHEQVPDFPEDHFIIEPFGRNTAPAIALAAMVLRKRHGDIIMGIFPADHLISKPAKFQAALTLACKKAEAGPNLVTLGIQPTFPATGYGYVEFDRTDESDVHKVIRFTEKPDLETAKSFLENGSHLWNGGMFIWKVGTILDAIHKHLPRTYQHLELVEKFIDTPKFTDALADIWPEVDAISIDYGILEVEQSIYTIETRFDWNDLGSWRTLYDVMPKDQSGNVIRGDVSVIDSKNSLIFSEDKFTAVVGVEDLIVVSMKDATVVLPRKDSERVQEVVQWLRARQREELL